ncbi:Cacna1h [Symbiodinium sp. CCMP2592]|nr:Cacna1h [Symbiodinium sp. CCMP2592]
MGFSHDDQVSQARKILGEYKEECLCEPYLAMQEALYRAWHWLLDLRNHVGMPSFVGMGFTSFVGAIKTSFVSFGAVKNTHNVGVAIFSALFEFGAWTMVMLKRCGLSFWTWLRHVNTATAGTVAIAVVATSYAAKLTFYGIDYSVQGVGFCDNQDLIEFPRGQRAQLRYLPCSGNLSGAASKVPEKIVTFWTAIDGCIIPIGMGYAVSGGVLICKHQVRGGKSMTELAAAGFPLYAAKAALQVSGVEQLLEFKLGDVVAPTARKPEHAISRDFAFMQSDLPARLGMKTRSLQFSFRCDATFETYHYRYDDDKMLFVLIRNVGSLCDQMEGVRGVYTHGIDTRPGDSGSVLLTVGTGEILGMRCGIIADEEENIKERLAIGSKQIYSHMREARMIAGKKGGILETCLLPQAGVEIYAPCAKDPRPHRKQCGGDWGSSTVDSEEHQDDFDPDDFDQPDDYDEDDRMYEGRDAFDEVHVNVDEVLDPEQGNGLEDADEETPPSRKTHLEDLDASISPHTRRLLKKVREQTTLQKQKSLEIPRSEGLWKRTQHACKKLIKKDWFECMISFVIVANSAIIGVDSHLSLPSTGETTKGPGLAWASEAEIFFLVFYSLELAIRAIALQSKCIRDGWFIFDAILVTSAYIEQLLSLFSVQSEQQIMILRLLRLIRLVRTFRMIRQIKSIWRLLYGLLTCGELLISTLALLGMVIYVFAVLGLETIASNQEMREDDNIQRLLDERFSSLGVTMMTLTQFVTLDSLSSLYLPLIKKNAWLMFYFLGLIIIVSIALMNLVTAVLVEGALEHARQDIFDNSR